jgi:hypothetical protein
MNRYLGAFLTGLLTIATACGDIDSVVVPHAVQFSKGGSELTLTIDSLAPDSATLVMTWTAPRLHPRATSVSYLWTIGQDSGSTTATQASTRVARETEDLLVFGVVVSNDGRWTNTYRGDVVVPGTGADSAVVPPPPPAADVSLQVVRFDGGTGPVLVSTGIPLRPGMLGPGQAHRARVFVAGVEQSIYAETLVGRHADGSARSVLVQFEVELGSAPLPAALVIGERQLPNRAKIPVAFQRELGLDAPPAAILPTDAQYLLSTGLVLPASRAPNSLNLRYETRFEEQAASRFAIFYSNVQTGLGENYYDRVLGHIAYWVRTADPKYWAWAWPYLIYYREGDVLKSSTRENWYSADPRNHAIEGLELHYLLTGDETSRRAVQTMASHVSSPTGWLGIMDTRPWDARIKARIILAMFTAWRLEVDNLESRYADRSFAPRVREAVNRTLGYMSADCTWRYANVGYDADGTPSQLNYMTSLILESLAKTHDLFEPDPRIPPAVRCAVDFLWTNEWVAADGAFRYRTSDTRGSKDLNMVILHGFGWTYRNTGDPHYRTVGDVIFDFGVRQTWFGNGTTNGDKQFNQHYRSSYQYLLYTGR